MTPPLCSFFGVFSFSFCPLAVKPWQPLLVSSLTTSHTYESHTVCSQLQQSGRSFGVWLKCQSHAHELCAFSLPDFQFLSYKVGLNTTSVGDFKEYIHDNTLNILVPFSGILWALTWRQALLSYEKPISEYNIQLIPILVLLEWADSPSIQKTYMPYTIHLGFFSLSLVYCLSSSQEPDSVYCSLSFSSSTYYLRPWVTQEHLRTSYGLSN